MTDEELDAYDIEADEKNEEYITFKQHISQ